MEDNLGSNGLDPETENAVRSVMDRAEQDIADATMDGMAVFMKRNHDAFRRAGFNRRQSFVLTAIMLMGMISR